METEKWSYRKKGERIVIECNRKYMAILPHDAKELFNILNGLRQSKKDDIASQNQASPEKKDSEKFVHSSLSEPKKDDAFLIPDAQTLAKLLVVNK